MQTTPHKEGSAMCDECGKETEDLVIIEEKKICKDCEENRHAGSW